MYKRCRLLKAILRLIAEDVNKEPDMLGNRDIGLLSPTYFKQALNEAIEVLPDESRLMIGGDNWHVEETYGATQLMRRLIGEIRNRGEWREPPYTLAASAHYI